ncbi:MAG TPA: tetratricopeptide repeat protein [Candidatus Angelobacter sp.]|nr:tetratricopeptide repeat protein [Candidatus Angelobacter sp.]
MKIKIILGVLLCAALAATGLWYFRSGTKLTEADSIIVGDFINSAGDPVFDAALREGLAISLAQSPLLNLISAEKVAEAMRSESLPANAQLTREIAPKLCQRLGATVFLNGSIARSGTSYYLKLSAFRCATTDELASAKADAERKEEVVHALGLAATELRGKLGEDPSSLKRFDLPLDRATTGSLDALKSFAEGRRLTREQGSVEAVPALKKAIELDPRFALAYSNLAVGYYNLNQNALAADRIRQAFELADRQTTRDRLHITTLYYDLGTGDVQKAIASYKEWVQLYPRDDIAKGNLASEYFLIGDYEQAASFAQQALRLDPGSAAWYENVSTAYIALMRLEEAQNILNQAFARKLDDAAMHSDLYALAFLQNDAVAMQREMDWSVGKVGGEDDMLALQADTEAYAGHLKKARELSRRAVESAEKSQLSEPAAIWQGIAALREAAYGNLQDARAGADKAIAIAPNSRDVLTLAILVLTRASDLRRAQTMLDDLAAANVSNTVVQSAWIPTIRAQAALINQKPGEAAELLETVKPYERGQLIGNLSYSCMVPVYLRGEAYLSQKQGSQALAEFQKLVDSRGVVGNCWAGALALLGQARAHALSGSTSAARAAYQRFFELWKSADADVPILKSARGEFAKLK